MKRNNLVDLFLVDGCGRCADYKTPACKVHKWPEELNYLREIILNTELTEEIKWGFPCYTLNGKNVLMITAFRDNCGISFFNGSFISDPQNLLKKPGENSQNGRVLRITKLSDITENSEHIEKLILDAIQIQKNGTIPKKVVPLVVEIPSVLADIFKEDPYFRDAFMQLTPGRRRAYVLFFNQPKNESTKISRIEKNRDRILQGLGMHD